jgi:hypothetical protein
MIVALKITVGVLLAFTALGIACAVRISLRRSIPQADPFFHPFGDVPRLTDAQLRDFERDPLRRSFATRPLNHSAGLALRPDADGGRPILPSWLASIRNFWRGGDAAA